MPEFTPQQVTWLERYMRLIVDRQVQTSTALIVSAAQPVGFWQIVPDDLTANTSEYVYVHPVTGLEFLYCNGATVSQTTYATLYSLWGTNKYGADSGGNFVLPDTRGRALFLSGTNANTDVGDNDGVAEASRQPKHTHTAPSIGSHTHGTSAMSVASHTHGSSAMTIASHSHNAGTLAVSGSASVTDPGHSHGVSDGGHSHSVAGQVGNGGVSLVTGYSFAGAATAWSNGSFGGTSAGSSGTGISINNGSTGISISGASFTIGGATATAAPGLSGSTDATAPAISGSTDAATPSSGDAGSGMNGSDAVAHIVLGSLVVRF